MNLLDGNVEVFNLHQHFAWTKPSSLDKNVPPINRDIYANFNVVEVWIAIERDKATAVVTESNNK